MGASLSSSSARRSVLSDTPDAPEESHYLLNGIYLHAAHASLFCSSLIGSACVREGASDWSGGESERASKPDLVFLEKTTVSQSCPLIFCF